MQTVTVVCVGNLKEGYWKDAAAEYQKRLGAFCKLLVVEIEEERLPQKPSLAQIAAGMKEEGRRIRRGFQRAVLQSLCVLRGNHKAPKN